MGQVATLGKPQRPRREKSAAADELADEAIDVLAGDEAVDVAMKAVHALAQLEGHAEFGGGLGD
jgi:hypothetical protein